MTRFDDIRLTLPPWCIPVLTLLDAIGEAWVVGGFVRDALIGRAADDVDIACSLPAAESMQALSSAGYTVIPTGIAHGTVTALAYGHPLEITTFRKDGRYLDGRHPESISTASTIQADLARRDFTVNALAWHPERGMVDPFGGLGDLECGILRAVGDASTRMQEDGLRVLRALRFASQLGFSLESDTEAAVHAHAALIDSLSGERILREMNKLLCGQSVGQILRSYPDVLSHVVPEIAACVGFPQTTKYHCYDVWEHTIHVVEATPPEPLVRWAALLHDSGKPATHFMRDGVSHFYGHPEESLRITRRVATRLRMPKTFSEQLCLLVLHHDDTIAPDERGISRFMRKGPWTPELFFTLCDLKAADALGHAPNYQGRAAEAIEMMGVLSEMLSRKEPFGRRDLAIDGNDLVSAGFEPGPDMGRVLRTLLDEVAEDELPNEREALLARAGELYEEHES